MSIDEILDRFSDYLECDEYHIHDGTGEHEGSTWLKDHENFDQERAKQAIKDYVNSECLKAALFALDNETLWQYQRKCNTGEAQKANRAWLVNLIESNIDRYKRKLNATKDKERDEAS